MTSDLATTSPADTARRVDELGRIILAYSDVTAKLEQSHAQLTATVESLRKELGEKNRLLERKQRLAALGEMAAGLAHEIRNPLGGIQLYASLLADDLRGRPELAASLALVGKIAGGVKRVEALVGQVLQFTREINANPVPIDLAEVVDQTVEYATLATAGRDIRCEVDGPRPMPVTADPLLIGQALLNLLLNAAEAMADAGRAGVIRVTFGPSAGDEARQFRLAAHDDGPGIPPDVMDRIFNPFFTTKDTGTGLGLAIVHRIVEAHEGTIMASNPAGGGAQFEIRI